MNANEEAERTASTSAREDAFTYFTEADWNFDGVPDEELVACCLWEYGRESSTIGLAADIHWCHVRHIVRRAEYESNPKARTEDDVEAQRIERRAKAAGFSYEAFSEKFWHSDIAWVEFYQTLREFAWEDSRSWSTIPPELRVKWARQVSESSILRPVCPALVSELEQLWSANRAQLDEVRSRPRSADDDSEEAALWSETEALSLPADDANPPEGKATVALTVDFARFTDSEILQEFTRWLKESRPKRWKRPLRVFPGSKRRGRKLIEYRVALERLRLMRLLHWNTPAELRRNLPKAWARWGRKREDFGREVRQVCKCFHRFFPFLPKAEQPVSKPRKGIWLPEMMAICEKVEREMALK
jgi:hypothetical protein